MILTLPAHEHDKVDHGGWWGRWRYTREMTRGDELVNARGESGSSCQGPCRVHFAWPCCGRRMLTTSSSRSTPVSALPVRSQHAHSTMTDVEHGVLPPEQSPADELRALMGRETAKTRLRRLAVSDRGSRRGVHGKLTCQEPCCTSIQPGLHAHNTHILSRAQRRGLQSCTL